MNQLVLNIILIVGVALATMLGEYLPLVLPYKSRHLNRKPFTCQPCLTFHLLWIYVGIVSALAQSWQLFAAGIVSAFILFAILKIKNKKNIIK